MHKLLWAAAFQLVVLAGATGVAAAAEKEFPFDQEMLLDVRPLPGSKRVPMLEIETGGRATIDLWCLSGSGRFDVTGETVTITLGPLHEEYCTPERRQRDEDLAAALGQVMQWSRKGDVLTLLGATELRYRFSTH